MGGNYRRCKAGLVCLVALTLSAFGAIGTEAAIGVFNWGITATDGGAPVHVEYRLNCAGSVSIQIINDSDQAVCTLGPFDDPAGLNSHVWDGTGASGASRYRARITATSPATGTAGQLVSLTTRSSAVKNIYGLAIDRCPTSPGYGTIYVSEVITGAGRVRAFYADGAAKLGFGGNSADNYLDLGFQSASKTSPYGVGVDDDGHIYVASRVASSNNTGIKVFDSDGGLLSHILTGLAQNAFWTEGLATSAGAEVYQTQGSTVRAIRVSDEQTQTVVTVGTGSLTTRQICFESGGAALYVATYGNSSPGVSRYVKNAGGAWVADSSFSSGLTTIFNGSSCAANYCQGVTCSSGTLWMGVALGPASGNLFRKNLFTGDLTRFSVSGNYGRIIAADAVGNVAAEWGQGSPTADLATGWTLYAPMGEASADTRTTEAVSLIGAASYTPVATIRDVRNMADNSLVELENGKIVTAVFSGCFYIGETERTCGVRVDCAPAVSEGQTVKLRGRVTIDQGERTIKDVEMIP